MMKPRGAHAYPGCEFFDAQWFPEIGLEPIDGSADALVLIVDRGHLLQMASGVAAQNAIEDFPLCQRRQRWNQFGLIQ